MNQQYCLNTNLIGACTFGYCLNNYSIFTSLSNDPSSITSADDFYLTPSFYHCECNSGWSGSVLQINTIIHVNGSQFPRDCLSHKLSEQIIGYFVLSILLLTLPYCCFIIFKLWPFKSRNPIKWNILQKFGISVAVSHLASIAASAGVASGQTYYSYYWILIMDAITLLMFYFRHRFMTLAYIKAFYSIPQVMHKAKKLALQLDIISFILICTAKLPSFALPSVTPEAAIIISRLSSTCFAVLLLLYAFLTFFWGYKIVKTLEKALTTDSQKENLGILEKFILTYGVLYSINGILVLFCVLFPFIYVYFALLGYASSVIPLGRLHVLINQHEKKLTKSNTSSHKQQERKTNNNKSKTSSKASSTKDNDTTEA